MLEATNPMSGSDVARLLGITRQTVSATTKRGLTKMYNYIISNRIAENPFEAMLILMSMCNVSDGSMEDVMGFLALFSNEVQADVKKHSPRKFKDV